MLASSSNYADFVTSNDESGKNKNKGFDR